MNPTSFTEPMATLHPSLGPVGPDTLITVKVAVDGTNRRFKLALRDLGAHTLPQKLRVLLAIPAECDVKFDRFSDSAGTYITLDSTDSAVYKQLYRAAKAKLKLRIRATILPAPKSEEVMPTKEEEDNTVAENTKTTMSQPRQSSYLETVLSHVPAVVDAPQSLKPSQYVYPSVSDDIENTEAGKADPLSRPTLPTLDDFACRTFSIDCNFCGKSVVNEHYHCSICEFGDFDLCLSCVSAGVTCEGGDHWLIKRYFKNGRVYPSVTETLSSKKSSETVPEKSIPKVTAPPAAPVSILDLEDRTCNSCITQYPASSFITCKDCLDFDLCIQCFEQSEHGHHPGHTFEPVVKNSRMLSTATRNMCRAGRSLPHDAVCDGCEKRVVGVRNKCMTCPDFDYCNVCVKDADITHPGHRFAPLYEQLTALSTPVKEIAVHRGIFCDGPICTARTHKDWIRGDRYKCAVCHDTDFCANCEALPTLVHNKTHPLIKMKTPIQHMRVSTINEDQHSARPVYLGDARAAVQNASTETIKPVSIHAATQVQTIAEVKPTEAAPVASPKVIEPEKKTVNSNDLQAYFESDSTPDGTSFAPGRLVSQSWTLRNPGPHAWPAGCAVHYIGGDDMRNLDMRHPSSVNTMIAASRSNVLEESLEPGKTAVFTVLLKSPVRQGRAISYWRLKTPEGHPFGHKLWVDITVAEQQVVVKQEIPVTTPVDQIKEEPKEETEEKTKEEVKEESVDQSQASSTMIFPTLEKESPESSIHDVAKAPSVAAASEECDLADDLESLELDDEDEDDGFLTDEEYDILDAEDEDFLDAAHKAVNQK